MKKSFAVLMSFFIFTICLGGCFQNTGDVSSAQPVEIPQSGKQSIVAKSQSQENAKREPAQVIRIVLPSEQKEMAEILKQIAEQEGIQLEIVTLAAGSEYMEKLHKKLVENTIDIFWLTDNNDFYSLQNKEYTSIDILNGGFSSEIEALAKAVPQAVRPIQSNEIVAGLPVGISAEGTLVNIEILAALLGTNDVKSLEEDLMDCSWEEWQHMVQSLQEFLKKPKSMKIKLDNRTYTTPRFRPESAKSLKAMFVFATENSNDLLPNGLNAALAAGQVDNDNDLNTSEHEKALRLEQPLQALFSSIDLQTNNATGEKQILVRGEVFSNAEIISAQDAQELFGREIALFYNSNTQTAFKIINKNKILKNKVVIIPSKMPLEDKNQDKKINMNLNIGVSGYLCVAETENKDAVEKIFFRLFTSEKGQKEIFEQLNAIPYTYLLQENKLANQVMSSVKKNAVYNYQLNKYELEKIQNTSGNLLLSEMMMQAQWGEEEKREFVNTVLKAMLLPVVEKKEEA